MPLAPDFATINLVEFQGQVVIKLATLSVKEIPTEQTSCLEMKNTFFKYNITFNILSKQ